MYYFGTDGTPYTGWNILNGFPYHFDQSGVYIESKSFTYFTNHSPGLHRFKLQSDLSMSFEIPSGTSAVGTTLKLAVGSTANEQYFELIPTGETIPNGQCYSYYIRNAVSGKVLAPTSDVPLHGSTIVQETLNYSERQKWVFESVEISGDLAYSWKIMPKVNPNLVIDVLSATSKTGTVLQLRERDGSNNQVFRKTSKTILSYKTHVADVGWQSYVSDSVTAGTVGQAKSLEAIYIKIANFPDSSNALQYNVHLSDVGWQGWKNNNTMAGTTGESRQMEAIQIKLTGEMASRYDIYYRAHGQDYGWQGWVINGATAGTTGQALQLEAIEIKLVRKGASVASTLSVLETSDTFSLAEGAAEIPEAMSADSASPLESDIE